MSELWDHMRSWVTVWRLGMQQIRKLSLFHKYLTKIFPNKRWVDTFVGASKKFIIQELDPYTWVLKTRLIEKNTHFFVNAKFSEIARRFKICKSSSAWNENLISGENGLRNHFWPLESVFLMRKSEETGPNFWGFQLPILRLTYLESSRNFRKFGINKKDGYFFSRLDGSSRPMCPPHARLNTCLQVI